MLGTFYGNQGMRRRSLQSTLFKPQKKCYQVTCHQASQKECQKGILHGAPPGPMGYRESKALFFVVSLSSKLDGCRQHLSLNQRSKDQSCNTTTALALVEAGRFGRFDTVFFLQKHNVGLPKYHRMHLQWLRSPGTPGGDNTTPAY